MIPEVILVSKNFYDGLNPEHQQILTEVIKDSEGFHNETWNSLEQETYQKLKQAGATVVEVDKEPYRQRVQGIYEDFKVKYGSEVIERIRQAGEGMVGANRMSAAPIGENQASREPAGEETAWNQ